MTKNKGSYEKINYSIRPAKSIERRMLVDALQRVHVFSPLRSYRYIGFGSTFFSDFSLFHRSLGINKMVSIEKDVQNEERFLFNRPYKCIDMFFTDSSNFLSSTDWEDKTIAWLDYDGKLQASILSDIDVFCARAISGSVIIVSVNAHPEALVTDEIEKEEALTELRNRIGEEKIPRRTSYDDLRGQGTAKLYREIINDVIKETLHTRNLLVNDEMKMMYKQLFNIHYSDGVRMLTVGGILYERRDENLLDMCHFNNINFIKHDNGFYNIEVPVLTFKEMRYIDTLLTHDGNPMERADFIPEKEKILYADIYRYFPPFAETNL